MVNSFEVGAIIVTTGIHERCKEDPEFNRFVASSLSRHSVGDWGDLSEVDEAANNNALKIGGRLFSKYKQGDDSIYIITEADRSMTTILFAEEY